MPPEHDDLLMVMRLRLEMLQGVVDRYRDRDVTDLSEGERKRVAGVIENLEAALERLW